MGIEKIFFSFCTTSIVSSYFFIALVFFSLKWGCFNNIAVSGILSFELIEYFAMIFQCNIWYRLFDDLLLHEIVKKYCRINIASSDLSHYHDHKNLSTTGFGQNSGNNRRTQVFSTRRRVILVARTRRKKGEENSVSTFGRFRLCKSFESSPVSVKDSQTKISDLSYTKWTANF